jgi:hypothetical protein
VNEEPLQKDAELEAIKQPEVQEVVVLPGYVNHGIIPVEPDLGIYIIKEPILRGARHN